SAAHVEAAAISAVIVIPAHDEEAVIQSTIRDAMREAGGAALVLVVADNCKDRTADVSRGAGASVLERSDPERRGKGFALAAARDHLRGNPPAVVIILDADCRIDAQSLRTLIAFAGQTARAGQAVN